MIPIEYVEIGCIAIAAFIMAADEALRHSPNVQGTIPRLRGFWRFLPAAFVLLAAAIFIGERLWPDHSTPLATSQQPQPEQKKSNLTPLITGVELSSSNAIPLMLSGTAAITTGKIRIYADFSLKNRGRWEKSYRFHLLDIDDVVKGVLINVPLSKDSKTENEGKKFFLGEPGKNIPIRGPAYVSIALIDDKGNEQDMPFIMMANPAHGANDPPLIWFTKDDLGQLAK